MSDPLQTHLHERQWQEQVLGFLMSDRMGGSELINHLVFGCESLPFSCSLPQFAEEVASNGLRGPC